MLVSDIGYLKEDKKRNDPAIVVLGQISLALKNARAHEPEWKQLSPQQAAEALGVRRCAPMWKLTITGRPNLSLENVRRLNKTTQARQDEFSRLRDLCNTKKDVKMSIITPRYKVDLFGLLRPIVDEAWKRDGGEPLQPFLEKSKYKHVINLGTIAPPEQAPYQKPVPAVVTFTDPKRYAVTMAYGNQSEYYCQHDQARDLAQATGMTAVFLADPGYVVKECGTPRVFIFWLRVPQSQISLEPKAGQSGYLILPRVKKLKYDLSDEELAVSRFSDTGLVANGILDALNQAANLNYTGPRLNSFLKDKLKAMLSDDEGSTDVDELLAAVVKINDDEDNDDDITMSQLKQLVAKTKSLKPPTTPQDPLLGESEPVRLSWRRIEGVGSLMPSDMACYRAQVPVDKATGAKRWPVKLDLPDLFRDANGNQIRQHTFVEKCRGHRGTPVQIFIEDSDKTYKTEMNAISKLVHPLTFNEHDRPSEAMHNLTSQIILNDIKDKLPTEHYVPIWRDLYNLANTLNPRLLEKYKRWPKDKKQAFLEILCDRKTVKLLIGPPGTGKTEFCVLLALTSLLTVGARDRDTERHGPVTGSQLSDDQLDQQLDALTNRQDASSPAESDNDQGNGQEVVNANNAPHRANFQVLYVLDMNSSVNDVVGNIQNMAKEIGLSEVAGRPLSVIRLHSIQAEIQDVPKKYLRIVNDLQRDGTETYGLHGTVLDLIVPMMRQVEQEYQQEKAERRVEASLTEATRSEYEEHGDRYRSLSHLINNVTLNPEIWPDSKNEIFRQVRDGPMAYILRNAHIVVATPVGAGDAFFRKEFKPDFVIHDEAARSKEVSSLILLAAHSPLIYLVVGDTMQNGPYVTSLYQHYETKTKMSTTVSAFGRDSEQVRLEKDALRAASGEEQTEPDPDTITDADDEIVVSELPQRVRNPNTFGPQLKQSLLGRLERGGSVHAAYLRQNFRHKGPGGQLFNALWYDNDLEFRMFRSTKSKDYQAAMSILARCGRDSEPMELPVWDEETQQPVVDPTTKQPKTRPVILQSTFKGNSIIIDMSSKESAHGNSYRNDAHLGYARQKLIDCLAAQPIYDYYGNIIWHKLQGIILYVCPYAAQLEAMKWAMRELGKWAYTSTGQLIEIDLSRFDFRTHLAVQGFQASLVIVDYVRSDAPGHSSDPQINNVMLSRACYAQILLLNDSTLLRVNQYAPSNVTLLNVFKYHRANDAVVDTLNYKDMVVCGRCVGLGHTSKNCPKSNDPSWKCHGCGKPHHPRDCRQLSRINAALPREMPRPIRPVNEAQLPPKPTEITDIPSKKPSQKTRQNFTLLAVKRAMRKEQADLGIVDVDTTGDAGGEWDAQGSSSDAWGAPIDQQDNGQGGWGDSTGQSGWGNSTGESSWGAPSKFPGEDLLKNEDQPEAPTPSSSLVLRDWTDPKVDADADVDAIKIVETMFPAGIRVVPTSGVDNQCAYNAVASSHNADKILTDAMSTISPQDIKKAVLGPVSDEEAENDFNHTLTAKAITEAVHKYYDGKDGRLVQLIIVCYSKPQDNDPAKKVEPASVRMYKLNASKDKFPFRHLVIAHNGANHYEAVDGQAPITSDVGNSDSSLPSVTGTPKDSSVNSTETPQPKAAGQDDVPPPVDHKLGDSDEEVIAAELNRLVDLYDVLNESNLEHIEEPSNSESEDVNEGDASGGSKLEQDNETSEAEPKDANQGDDPSSVEEDEWVEWKASGDQQWKPSSTGW